MHAAFRAVSPPLSTARARLAPAGRHPTHGFWFRVQVALHCMGPSLLREKACSGWISSLLSLTMVDGCARFLFRAGLEMIGGRIRP
jgi:hypothetical protein